MQIPMLDPRATARRFRSKNASGSPFAGCAHGVGHEVKPLPDVRCPEARSAEIRRPDGVTLSFQIRRNNVEPSEAVTGRNLLTKADDRAALADEPEPCRP
jgi:hypothetical protein